MVKTSGSKAKAKAGSAPKTRGGTGQGHSAHSMNINKRGNKSRNFF